MSSGASNLRDSLLPALDVIRGIPGQLGMRLYTVTVVQRTWSGVRAGIGNSTDLTSGVKIDLGIYQTKVTQLTQKDVIASGGFYSDQDLKVGPITPPYQGSAADNDAITIFDPLPSSLPVEIFFNIVGPGMPSGGAWCRKIAQDVTKNLHYTFTVRRTAEIP